MGRLHPRRSKRLGRASEGGIAVKDWISVNQNELNTACIEEHRGVKVQAYASPFDIPVAVRGSYDEKTGRLALDFRYFTEEEDTVQQSPEQHVTLLVGKNSSRIHRIELDLEKMDVDVAARNVVELLSALGSKPRNRLNNFMTAGRAISQKREEIFSEFGGHNRCFPVK